MFTGIARGAFPVRRVTREPALLRYAVEIGPTLTAGLVVGASVAIDGACQTVVAVDGGLATFEAIQETLDRTTLGALREGDRVNVERSLRAGDEIGGHEVSGHVSTTGMIGTVHSDGHVRALQIQCGDLRYVLPKGFVAVHGCSLTVGAVSNDAFDVHLIPETLRLTNLGEKKVGDRVNLEWDARTVAIVETTERVLLRRSSVPSWSKS